MITYMTKQGAIGSLVAFIIGINFAIPNQANIGFMIVDSLATPSSPESFLALVPLFKEVFVLLGILIIIGDLIYIIGQFKQGNL